MARFRTPTPQQINTMRRIAQEPDLMVFLEMLRIERATAQRGLVMAEAPHDLYRLQGCAAVLDELIDAVESSPQRAERTR